MGGGIGYKNKNGMKFKIYVGWNGIVIFY